MAQRSPQPFHKRVQPQRALLLGVLALGCLLATAETASAEHRKLRFGVTESSASGPDLRAMNRANVRVLRMGFSWVGIAGERRAARGCTNRGIYDWNGDPARRASINYDRVVETAGRNGVKLLPVIVGSPRYVATRSTHAPDAGNRREMRDFRCFVRALVNRYGRNGVLTRGNSGIGPITSWQVWNEPNLPAFATENGVNPREYARLVKVTRSEILGEDPRAKIILAGLPELTKSGFSSRQFLRQLYRVKGVKRRFDAVALHPYAFNYRGVEGAMIRLRELLRRVGDRQRRVWITEVGWATQGRNLEFLVKGTKGQARQLRKTFKMLRQNRKRFKVGTVAWFRWRDQATRAQNSGPFDYAGLFTKGGSPKRSCRAFVGFTNGRCAPIQGSTSSSASTSLDAGVGALAASEPE